MDQAHLRGFSEKYPQEEVCSTFYQPSVARRQELIARGYNYQYIGHWVSNLTLEDLVKYSQLLSPDICSTFDVELAIDSFEPFIASQPTIVKHFDDCFKLTAFQQLRYVGGRYLRVALATNCDVCAREILKQAAGRLVAEIQIKLGLGAASSLALECLHSFKSEEVTFDAESIILNFSDIGQGLDISSLSAVGAQGKVRIVLSAETQALFEASVRANAFWQKFLFLWLAMESRIGNGHKRRTFFENEIGSLLINEEVKRLHELRSAVAHDANFDISSKDYISLFFAFRISLVYQSKARVCLVREFEQWLLNDKPCHGAPA